MDSAQAQRAIESLRNGIPPDGFVRHFTVGRQTEIDDLIRHLGNQRGTALLLKANYGSGKTHLLRFIREEALAKNYAVSIVSLDARSAVRFNRMDQIFGAICRNIEVPQASSRKGIRPFFDLISKLYNQRPETTFWRELTNYWKWDFSEKLDSPALFVALRAWIKGDAYAQDLVEDWLYNPWLYKTQRRKLYEVLVSGLRKHFRDPRSDNRFYANQVFIFDSQEYYQSWAALRDLNNLADAAGLIGLIILFDEFEDVITNLRNVAHQEAAFWNLFRFYSGKQFPGKTFYTVTPEFVEKCKARLLNKGRWDFDFSRFESLPKFELSPLDTHHLVELTKRIVRVHGLAYAWDAVSAMNGNSIQSVLEEATRAQIQDRTRHAITCVVQHLDDLLQGRL